MKVQFTPVDFSRKVVCVMGLPFDALSMAEAVEQVRAATMQRKRLMLSTANLNFVVAARTDEAFRDSIIRSQLSLADGMPIVWVARLLGVPIPERVTGSGLFEALREHGGQPAVKVFFFGGPEGVAEAASAGVNRQPDGLSCVGFDFPGYTSVEAMSGSDLIERINQTNADFVVVSLGAKKGQAWIERNRAALTAPVISHLGAVVSFAAGTVRRAPVWMQRLGLEWAWRIREEPSLWRRYRTDGWVFLQILVSNVIPLWWNRLGLAITTPPTSSSVSVRVHDSCVQLKLTGSLDAHHLSGLRAAFTEAAAASTRIRLDLADVDRIDSAAMGLMLLLYGHQRDVGWPLELHGASKALQRQFRYLGTEFLLARRADRARTVADVEHIQA